MAGKVEVATLTGPIRVRVSGAGKVRVHVASAPVAVRVLGSPGPEGKQGLPGPPGNQGPPGGLDAGIVIDGGNF